MPATDANRRCRTETSDVATHDCDACPHGSLSASTSFASLSEDRPATCVSNDNDKTCRERVRVLPGFFFLKTNKATPFRDRVCLSSAGRFAISVLEKSPKLNIHTYANTQDARMEHKKSCCKKRRNIHGPVKTIP